MTHETDAISTLIADIDSILHKASSRRPWLRSVDVQEQRRLLEQVRTYLVSRQQSGAGDEARHQENYQPQATARQIVQAVEQDMEAVRTSLMQSLQGDLESLRQQRESLVLEIRQMESYRLHHRTLAQQQAAQQQLISEFLQVLSSRLQESLAQQMAQTLRNLETQFLSAQILPPESQKQPYNSSPSYSDAISSNSLPLHPQERLEQLQTLQAKSDQLLATLDSTIRTVFEALQRNLFSYQESLSQGLDKMHNLGQQSELMFTELVNQLTEQLQQEASAILQSSRQISEVDASSATTAAKTPETGNQQLPYPQREPRIPLDQPHSAPPNRNEFNFSPNDVTVARQPLPYPGVELPPRSVEQVQPQSPQLNLPADRLGESVQRQPSQRDNFFGTTSPSTTSNPASGAQSSDLEDLNLENLGNLEAASLDDDDMKTIFQTEPILPATPERRRDEIDDFFESLFGTPPLPKSTEPQGQSAKKQQEDAPAVDTQIQAESKDPIIPQDSAGARKPHSYSSQDSLEDALFAGLGDPAEDATIAQPPARAEQIEESWEDVLFPEDWEITVVQAGNWAAPTIARDDRNVETNEAFNTETVEAGDLVISALTDLLQEQEVPPEESFLPITTLPSVEEITQIQNTQIQNTQIQNTEQPATEEAASLEEDIYIPASPDENLLLMDTFSVDQEEFFWLDRDTLQLLSEDLSSFEAPQGDVFPESEEQGSDVEADFIDNGTEIQTQGAWFAQQEEIFGMEIAGGTVDVETQEEQAPEATQRTRHSQFEVQSQETLPVTELDELLMEDWDDLALDSFLVEDSVPLTDGESERLPSEELSLAETENAIAHQQQNSNHQEQPETAANTVAANTVTEPDERPDWNLASLFPVEPLNPPPDKAIAFLPPANPDESSEVSPSLGLITETELGTQEEQEYIADSQQQTLGITSTETPEAIDFDESLAFLPEAELNLELPTQTAALDQEYVADWEWEEPANPPWEAPEAIDFDESLAFLPEAELNLELPTETAALEQEYVADSEAQQTPEITDGETTVSIEFDESWGLFADEEQIEPPRERAIASDIDALTALQEEDLGDWEFEEMPEISQVEITHPEESEWEEELLRLEVLITPPDDAHTQFPLNSPIEPEEEAVSELMQPETSDDSDLDIFSDSSTPEKKTP
ncbi:hypothetical protein [Coleofasciculus sp. H7-2]|uniref:hypothetical protein n=1 Tax=Coleofasciculus sp. H7-2 TaxID=3351545 RepID=UPI00366F6A8C